MPAAPAREGAAVRHGDVLLTLVAMKRAAAIRADHAGTMARIVAPVGTQVEAKDLLIELQVQETGD